MAGRRPARAWAALRAGDDLQAAATNVGAPAPAWPAVRLRTCPDSVAGRADGVHHGPAGGGPGARSRPRTWHTGWGRQTSAPTPAGSAGRDQNLFLANYSCFASGR